MPALTFDDFDALAGSAGQAAPAERSSSRALSVEDFDQMAAVPVAKRELDGAGRIGGSLFSGIVNAGTGLAGLPADFLRYGQAGLDWAQARGQGRTYEDVSAENEKSAPFSREQLDRYGSAGLREKLFNNVLPKELDFKPEGRGEKALETIASFGAGGAPMGALRSAQAFRDLAAIPAAGAIGAGTAAHVAGLGPTGEAIAEGVGGVLGGGLGAFVGSRTTPATAILRDKARGMDPADLRKAQDLLDFDRSLPGPQQQRLSLDEAYAQVTGQTNNPLSNMRTVVERTPEGSSVFGPIMAERAQRAQAAAQAGIEGISPTLRAPGELGPVIQQEARAAFNATPEGRQMAETMRATGPRMSPGQAGEVIQPEMRRVYDQRMLAREDATAPLYREAEQAPERIGVDRYLTGERPGDPVITEPRYSRPQFDDAAPAPLEKPSFAADAGESAGMSLGRFVKQNGGIELSGDVKAAGLGEMPVPGVGYVAHEGGKSIDGYWRTKLKEAGYLQRDADGYTTSDITNLLIRKLQNEQRGVPSFPNDAQRRVGRTASSQADEYANDLSLWQGRLQTDLKSAGIAPESIHPDVQSRVMGALMRGEEKDPLAAYERTVSAMRENPAPYVKSTTVEEPIYAPRFGQANPQGTLDYINRQLETAKDPIRSKLIDARNALMTPAGETDLSIGGLSAARKAINAQLKDQPKEVQSQLLSIRNRLDADMSVAPEYERARSEFERLSRPLDAFEADRPLGRVVEQDQRTRRQLLPAEQVTQALASPSAAREFAQNATPNARRAFERQLTTQILDGVSDGRRDFDAAALHRAIRSSDDTLREFPEVRQRLINVAVARDGLQRAEQSTILGRVSRDPDVKVALRELFNPDPLPETANEISKTVSRIAQRNPRAASELLRLHMEATLNSAQHELMSGGNQKAGAKFAVALKGHPQQQRNFEAIMKALPNGEKRLQGFNRLLDVLEATGKAPSPQSGTAFFTQTMKEASGQPMLRQVALAAKTGGISAVKQINEFAERVALGRNMGQMANLLTRSDSGRILAQLAETPSRASRAQVLALRLSYMGRQGGNREE